LSLKLLYLELRSFEFRRRGFGTRPLPGGLAGMYDNMRSKPPLPSRRAPKIRLNLRTRDGDSWDLTVSTGMERFIGSYSRVPGLGSSGPLLDFQPVGCARSG
jgi:hypothetical protein